MSSQTSHKRTILEKSLSNKKTNLGALLAEKGQEEQKVWWICLLSVAYVTFEIKRGFSRNIPNDVMNSG